MERKALSELNLIDDFLFEEAIKRGKKGERFAQILLQTILGKKFRTVKVVAQNNVRGVSPMQHGIRLDAYVEAAEDTGIAENVRLETGIYDIEPNGYQTKSEPRRMRYYHALIDAKILQSGVDYSALKNVSVIMILPFDPFGKNRMMYTIVSTCKEDPSIKYDDGLTTIYLYTKGTKGNPSRELMDMLKYIETSTKQNAVSQPLLEIQALVEEIKHDGEVGVSYMQSWEREMMYREEGEKIFLVKQICKKLRKEKDILQIADELETEPSEIEWIVKAAEPFAPEYDAEKVWEAAKNHMAYL